MCGGRRRANDGGPDGDGVRRRQPRRVDGGDDGGTGELAPVRGTTRTPFRALLPLAGRGGGVRERVSSIIIDFHFIYNYLENDNFYFFIFILGTVERGHIHWLDSWHMQLAGGLQIAHYFFLISLFSSTCNGMTICDVVALEIRFICGSIIPHDASRRPTRRAARRSPSRLRKCCIGFADKYIQTSYCHATTKIQLIYIFIYLFRVFVFGFSVIIRDYRN